jgi:hypothetical protein
LRTDIIDDRHSALVQFARQPQVEVGEVDEHGHVRPVPFRFTHDLSKPAIDVRNMLDDLDNPHFSDLSGVN